MQKRKSTLLISLLLVVLVVLAGCGPRAGSGERAAAAAPSDIVVDLPAIYIDFDEQGVPTTGGMSLSQAGALLGRQLPDVALGADVVKAMKQYNIQHVQLINAPDGLTILVNGLRMPSLGWNAEVLTNLRALLSSLGIDLGQAGAILPLLGTFGTGLVIRFPVAAGMAAIPLVDPAGAAAAAKSQEAIKNFASGVGEAAQIAFTVDYKPDGTWTVQGQDAAAWEKILPIGWEGFNLKPAAVQGAIAAGIKTMEVTTKPDGVHISINGESLPVITWGNGELSNILSLVKQSGMLSQVSGDNPQVESMLGLVEEVLPSVQAADFSMTVNFPTQ